MSHSMPLAHATPARDHYETVSVSETESASEPASRFWSWLDAAIHARRWTYQRFGDVVGLHPSIITKYRRGSLPSRTTCDKIAEKLGIDRATVRWYAGYAPESLQPVVSRSGRRRMRASAGAEQPLLLAATPVPLRQATVEDLKAQIHMTLGLSDSTRWMLTNLIDELAVASGHPAPPPTPATAPSTTPSATAARE